MITMQEVERVWENEVYNEYKSGNILNERTLQAILFKYLTNIPGVNACVEPRMTTTTTRDKVIVPDIVIYGTDVKMIAELKFVPHHYPNFEKDIASFCTLVESVSQEQYIKINPKTGQYAPEICHITEQTRFAFFVIGKIESKALEPANVRSYAVSSSVRSRLSIFHGTVGHEGEAKFGADLSEV